jgi:hypothetical protein
MLYPSPMTGEQYQKAIDQIGLTQVGAAAFFGLTSRTLRNYQTTGPPMAIAMLLRVMIAEHISVDEVNQLMKRKAGHR